MSFVYFNLEGSGSVGFSLSGEAGYCYAVVVQFLT